MTTKPTDKDPQTKRPFSLRHMFSTRQEASITEEEADELIEAICKKLAEKHLLEAAVLALETTYPATFYGSQALLVLEPLLGGSLDLFFPGIPYRKFQALMENRRLVQRLLARMDEYIDDRLTRRKTAKNKRWRWR